MRVRTPTKILVGIAVLVVAGFAAAYFVFFTPDSPDRLTLSDAPAPQGQAAGGTTTSAAGIWRVAGGSEAGYRVREKLAALPAQSDAVGRTSAVTGQVRIDDSGGGVTATDARFEVDLRQLRSDESRRDSRIRTEGLESDRFPTATFVAAEPVQLAELPAAGQIVTVNAVGDLTVHGVTRRVTIPVDARLSGDQIELVGSHTFPMSDFGIDPPRVGGFVTVEPDATLEFKLVLEKG